MPYSIKASPPFIVGPFFTPLSVWLFLWTFPMSCSQRMPLRAVFTLCFFAREKNVQKSFKTAMINARYLSITGRQTCPLFLRAPFLPPPQRQLDPERTRISLTRSDRYRSTLSPVSGISIHPLAHGGKGKLQCATNVLLLKLPLPA